jgi:Na+/proline symporter
MRPSSIIWFERLFLASIAVGVLNSALIFPSLAASQPVSPAFLIGTIVVGVAINLALWWFAARRGSNAARIILTILFALGLASVLFTLTMGTYPPGTAGLLSGINWVLQVAAVVFLYRPDANAWFRGTRDHDLGETFE